MASSVHASALLTAPSPPSLPLIGSLLEFRGNPFQNMLDWRVRYGDVIAYRLGRRQFHMISHPALAEEVLITRQNEFIKMYERDSPAGVALVLGQGLATSRGDLWKRQRRLMQPLFQRSRLPSFVPEINAAARRVAERWSSLAPASTIDVAHEMMRATLEIITRTMFSVSVLDRVDTLSPALATVLRYSSEHLSNPFQLPLWLPTPANRAFRNSLALLDELIGTLIRERRAEGRRCDDLLGKLLHAVDTETGEAMDDRQIRDECLTIFIAGHETTAVALSWCWHLLGANREVRARLHAELDAVIGDRAPTLEDLPSLPWTRAVLEETMRLFPPAIGVVRKTVADTQLGGYRIPGGTLVFVNIANIHRHPDFWEQPDHFRPERFLADSPAPGHRLAYMPFGAGPRVCLGNHFAMTEGALLLAALARQFRLDPVPGISVEPEIVLALRPKGGLGMRLERR
ncbi:cytochrome P450 [Methylotetracoccus oryzae]|uniref:cytochrome P450 n=1 Tax=Methylotetracoccus oryzae TaxID=1919059 RepID=UPI001117DD16|nr:cytochrome P450 [Methylotetracoccus oryzae]